MKQNKKIKLEDLFGSNPIPKHLQQSNKKQNPLQLVKENLWAIKQIENPSEKVQLAAVNQNWNVIKYIKNPSEKVQLAAVNQNGYAIQFVENPSEKIIKVAYEQNPNSAKYFKREWFES